MRVALVAASLDIIGGHGVEAQLLERALRAEGHDVVFVPINQRFPRSLNWVRRYRGLRTLVNELLYVADLRRLAKADIVQVFSASYWSFLLAPVPALLASRILGKRVILHYHSGEAQDHLAHWGWGVHPWLRLAHEIVVPSEYLRCIFARYGYHARVIHNIVDVSAFVYRERSTFRPRFVSTRALEGPYGVDVVIRAFERVVKARPDAELVIAGTGREEASLRALAATCGGRVTFLGRVEPAAMPSVLANADFFLNASVVDNQPVSILEACASGLAVVSTGTGAIADMLGGGVRGVVVSPADPDAMARAVIALLDAPEETRAMTERARAHIELFTWAAVGSAWARVYESPALAKRSVRRRALTQFETDAAREDSRR